MIYDSLAHIRQYEHLHPNLKKGLEFLAAADFSQIPLGRVEIDGDNVFANVMEYTTRPAEDATSEAHKDYADIQYLLEGEELMGVAPLEDMEEEVEAHPERDIWIYRGETAKLPMGGGRFVVAFPGDAHAPSLAVDQPGPAKKCVIKVKM